MAMTKVVALVGPTASGKSTLAVEVALALRTAGTQAEIVNADSMLVYRGMDIGTAKPSPAELAAVRHHLVDIMDVTETAAVADFQRLARAAIADCHSRGVWPILVGGSALYIRAIVDDFDFPGTDPDVRGRWEDELARVGAPALHAVLAARDPDSAALILPGNGRRIVRALEVLDLTGSFSASLPEWKYLLPGVRQYGLALDRAELDRRIELRVHQMWDQGFVSEVTELERRGLRSGRTASRALGYRQVLSYLADEVTEAEAMLATVHGTRRFARKQLGWFRRDPRITWLAAGDPGNVTRIVDDLQISH